MRIRNRTVVWSVILAFLGLVCGALVCPPCFSGLVSWLVPYETIARLTTCDTLGRPCSVEVDVKYTRSMDISDSHPRIRVRAEGPGGRARIVTDTGFATKISCVRAIPGGIDVFRVFEPYGGMKPALRFLIEGDRVTLLSDPVEGTPRQVPRWLAGSQPAALHDVLGAIDGVWGMEADRFNPVALIQVVNMLQVLGPETAVTALRAYLPPKRYNADWRSERHLDGVHLILRLLFVPRDPTRPIPPLRKGLETDLSDEVLKHYPDFPLVTIRGVPFLLSPGQGRYGTGEKVENPSEHLDFCLANAVFRSGPIVPEADPIQAADELIESPIWKALRRSSQSEHFGTLRSLRLQVLFALGRVVPATADAGWRLQGLSTKLAKPGSADQFWEERTSELRAESPVWDRERQDFVAARYFQKR